MTVLEFVTVRSTDLLVFKRKKVGCLPQNGWLCHLLLYVHVHVYGT